MGSKTWYATKHTKNGGAPHPAMGTPIPGGPIKGSMNPREFQWSRNVTTGSAT